jgi:hypothetical protein
MTTTTNKSLNDPANGSLNWDIPLNSNFDILDAALGSQVSIDVTGVGTTPVTLTLAQYQCMVVLFSGTLTANVTYQVPDGVGGQWIMRNIATGNYTITFQSAHSGSTSVVIPKSSSGIRVWTNTQNAFVTGGTTVDLSGNVGIGTGSPNGLLELSSATPSLYFGETDQTTDEKLWRFVTATKSFSLQTVNDANSSTANAWVVNRGTGVVVSNQAWYASGNEQMRLTSDGLGILTTSPYGTLTVGQGVQPSGSSPSSKPNIEIWQGSNDVNDAGGIDLRGSAAGLGYGWRMTALDSTGVHLAFANRNNSATYTEQMRITSAGDVGIGTSSPTYTLEVSGVTKSIAVTGTGSPSLNAISSDATGIPFVILENGSYSWQNRNNGASGDLSWAVSGSERMRITLGGNLVIGNGDTAASPISSTLRTTNGSGTDIAGASLTIQGGRGTGTGAGGSIIFSTSAQGTTGSTLNAALERMRILSSGNVGIGTTAPSSEFEVVGQFANTNYGSYSSLFMRAANGTLAVPTQITASTVLGIMDFRGLDNASTFRPTAQIRSYSDGAITSTSSPGYLSFFTTPSGSVVAQEAMRIASTGNIGIGGTATVTPLHVTGDTITTGVVYKAQPTQTSKSGAATLTIAELLTGIVQLTGGSATLTLPTETAIESGLPATFPTNMSFDVSFINTGSGTLTIGANGSTTVGLLTVSTSNSGIFRFRKTALNTYTVYRIA